MASLVLTAMLSLLAGLLGYGLGQGVPRLIQRSGALARRSPPPAQLALAVGLLTPWIVGAVGLLLVLGRPWLLVPLLAYALGMAWGRRRLGL